MFGWFGKKKERESRPPPAMAAPAPGKPRPPFDGYWVFTKAFDREIAARDLRAEVNKWAPESVRELEDAWARLKAPSPELHQTTKREDQFLDRWRSGHSLGSRPLVTILADHSGSLKGEPSEHVARILLALSAALESGGIAFEVLGFTTSSWRGGKSRKQWLEAYKLPAYPGRLCDLLHIVYRDASSPAPDWAKDLVLVTSNEVLKENVDGEALLWAAQRAERFAPSVWVCLCVTDGAPVDDSTISANGGGLSNWFLQEHLDAVVRDFEADENTRLGCLSLAPDDKSRHPYRVVIETRDAFDQAPIRAFDVLESLIWPTSRNASRDIPANDTAGEQAP